MKYNLYKRYYSTMKKAVMVSPLNFSFHLLLVLTLFNTKHKEDIK